MPVRVYLADLRYNYSGVLANDCMPLGVAYIKAAMDREDVSGEIDSRIFVYPDVLLEALRSAPPDVLMLSNYVWNEALSHWFFGVAKQLNPRTLTIMGGPNISLEPERQMRYLQQHSDLDIYALGEGDFLGNHLVRTFMDCGLSIRAMGSRGLQSCVFRDGDGNVQIDVTKPRFKEVGEIPSPWLSGIQDEFFDGKLAPMIETNRGCPFTCTFCVQGTSYYTKVHNFTVERVCEEIHYIAKLIRQRSPNMGTLRIADSNYGMFERDIEISRYIGQMQRDYGWPTFIDATTGKNRPDRIIKSVEQVSGALVLYQAVQSLDEDVLRKVKRQTIKLEGYKALEVHMRGRGLRSVSDLILGLPGESLSSHLRGLHSLLDSNIHQMHNFQAMMLKGAEMETVESRRMFSFDTRFRVLPKNFGVYNDEKVFDVEEIIVATDTLPFEDYVTARKWHLVSSVFWNDGWFADVVRFANAHGIKNSEWWSAMLPALENGTETVQAFLRSFVAETTGELFPTREACVAFYSQDDNFRKLQAGEIGDNLMYRYRALASFYLWDEICATAMQATRGLLVAKGVHNQIPDFDRFWMEFTKFISLRHASGRAKGQILSSTSAQLHYDFPSWLAQSDLTHPENFCEEEPADFDFRFTADALREMESAIEIYTTQIKGLSKLVTRINVDSQVRRCTRRSRVLAATA